MIAYIALFSWPLVSLAFFKRFSVPLAVILTILLGYLILPEKVGVDFPVLPELNKRTIPALTALVLALVLFPARQSVNSVLPGLLPQPWLARSLIALLIFAAFMTAITNTDALRYGPTRLPALRPYDAMSYILNGFMFLLPMVLARKYLASPQSHRLLLTVLLLTGLFYAVFILVELRMSPLLHYWVYGSFPHSWIQHVRGGSWRPIVFLNHGLLVGIFLSATVLAAFGLVRVVSAQKGRFLLAAVMLFLILSVSKNLGALIITAALLPAVILFSQRAQLLMALIIASLFLSYPLMRDTRIVPIEKFVESVQDIDPKRAHSFLVRLENENAFLEKISERPLFGWGGWARARTYNEISGVDTTLADGAWIITLAVSGWAGYIARFGLICGPIFLLFMYRRRLEVGIETSVLTLVLAGNLIDLVPNSSLTPVTALIAGALWGRVELGYAAQSKPIDNSTESEHTEPANVYTRQIVRIERERKNGKQLS